MQLSPALKHLGQVMNDNSPAILTALGMVGTVTTAVLAAQGGMKANRIIHDYGYVDKKEQVKGAWKCYIPAAAVGTATVVCVFGANKIASNRTTAAIAAYSFAEKAFTQYKEKVVEIHGENKERKIRDEVAQDVIQNIPGNTQVFVTGKGDVLCYESLTGRLFKSDMETLRKAQNDLNESLFNNEPYVALNDLFEKVGLPLTGFGETLGWNTDKKIELQFSTCMTEDNEPAILIGYRDLPFHNYQRIH